MQRFDRQRAFLPAQPAVLSGCPTQIGNASALAGIIEKCLSFERAGRYQSFSELEAALNEVHQALRNRIPLPEDTATLSSGLHMQNLAPSLLSLGRFDKAAQAAGRGIEQSPETAEHWLNRGVALANLGQMRESADCLTCATELSPANALAWANLGWARMELGDATAGLKATMSATRLDDELAEAWWNRGECERRLGQMNQALSSFRRPVSARAHDWRGHFYLGSCLLEAGDAAEASRALGESARINPNYAESWRLLAVGFGKLGRIGEARQAIDRAVELEPNNSEGWAIRAEVLFQSQGVSAAVRECLNNALKFDPSNNRALRLEAMVMGRSTAETSNPKQRNLSTPHNRGGGGEPYCSAACFEKAGNAIFAVSLGSQQGRPGKCIACGARAMRAML